MRGAAGAVAFLGGVILLLPPTETKATWTSVNRAAPARVYDPQPTEAEPFVSPVAYGPAPVDSELAEPAVYVRLDEAVQDDATAREIRIAEDDRAYGDGYAWAAENDVRDERECRRLRGPQAGGCRDYVASLMPDRGEADRDF